MELRGTARRLVGAGFVAVLLVGAAPGAQAAAPSSEIVNANSGRNTCVTLTHIDANGIGQVRTQNCVKSANQRWVIAGGKIRNPAFDHCLSGLQEDIFTAKCSSTDDWQKWSTTSGDKKWIKHQITYQYVYSSGADNEEVVYRQTQATANRWYFRTW